VREKPAVSVVIPTLNEQAAVAAAVRSVIAEAEVIVVDGGSLDATVGAALASGAAVVTAARGRGRQLAAGAATAEGDWLVFLHADTRLEPGWAQALSALSPDVVGGAFRFALDSPRASYRWIEAGVRLRCRLFELPYGDQAIFARREAYRRAGGFAPMALFEDVDFVGRLRRVGRLAFPSARAFTSARRWEQKGVLRTILSNWWVFGLYAAGANPSRLERIYSSGRTG
jgi:hypothetical protein